MVCGLSYRWTIMIAGVMMILLASLPLIGCGDDDDDDKTASPSETPTTVPSPEPTMEPKEDTVLKIGNLTDLTGPAAIIYETVNMALEDMVKYFNEENLIPGIKLEVLNYDVASDPSQSIPAYEWLTEKGADVLYDGMAMNAPVLAPRAKEDERVIFGLSGNLSVLDPTGNYFFLGDITEYLAWTTLSWIAENDWDYDTQGPAKIGGAGWNDGYSNVMMDAMMKYAEAHPDQFDWVGSHLTPIGTFTWGPEIEALKDCNYIFPGSLPVNFVKDYRAAGYTATMMGPLSMATSMTLWTDAQVWDEFDGALLLAAVRWWNEDGEIINLQKELLNQYHPDEVEEIIAMGASYMAAFETYVFLNIIAEAARNVGPENIDQQALYDAAISFSLTVDGVKRGGFSEAKRDFKEAYAMTKVREAERDVIRLDEEWFQVVTEP